MTSPFSAAVAVMDTVLDEHFGERFEFRPTIAAPGGGRRAADGTRSVRTMVGILTDEPFSSKSLGAEERTATRAAMAQIMLSIDARQFAPGSPPRHLDRFLQVETGRVFEVATPPQLESQHRYELRVTLVKVETA